MSKSRTEDLLSELDVRYILTFIVIQIELSDFSDKIGHRSIDRRIRGTGLSWPRHNEVEQATGGRWGRRKAHCSKHRLKARR